MDAYASAEREEERTYKSYREVLANTALRLSRAFHIEVDAGSARDFADSLPSWPAFPDAKKALRRFGENGHVRYVLSNVDTRPLEETIINNGLEVDGVVTAEEVRSYKPRHEHWVRLMEKSGARKEEILHVAQSIYHDLVPAQDLGITACWVNRYREQLTSHVEPLFKLDSLAQLGRIPL